MKKWKNMGNLHAVDYEYVHDNGDWDVIDCQYIFDGPITPIKDGLEMKKGVLRTTEEDMAFLDGLEKLGKGD